MKDNYIKNTWNMIFYNFKTFMSFEFLFKTLLGLIILPSFIYSFNLLMKVTGTTYITVDNIGEFLWNRVTFSLLFIFLIILALIIIFDIATMIVIFDESYHKNKISLGEAIKISYSKCKNIFTFKNILVCFLVLFFMPFLSIGIEANIITSLKIPEFITNFFTHNKDYFIYGIGIYLILIILSFKWIFSLHYMIIEEKNFKNARKYSRELIHKRVLLDIIEIFFGRLVFIIVFIFSLLVLYTFVVILHNVFMYLEVSKNIIINIIWILLLLTLLIFIILSNGVSYAIISSLFYKHKIKNKERIIAVKHKMILKNRKNNESFPYFLFASIIIAILGGVIFAYQLVNGMANFNIEFLRETEVTAHRGASAFYPENTMAAFKGAKNLGADWIELDVQQTKDHKLVVFHDENLIRITGVDKYIYDLTYEELLEYDVGCYFGEDYCGEKIPLLSDVIVYAKEAGIRLNIEIKPNGHESNIEEQVVALIHKYHFEDLCVVSSLSYQAIEKVKAQGDITTLYVVADYYGNLTDYTSADAYSVETLFITEDLVHEVHSEGKEIYVWTVNENNVIDEMIDLNVDNIVTDNIELTKESIIRRRSSSIVQDFVNNLDK